MSTAEQPEFATCAKCKQTVPTDEPHHCLVKTLGGEIRTLSLNRSLNGWMHLGFERAIEDAAQLADRRYLEIEERLKAAKVLGWEGDSTPLVGRIEQLIDQRNESWRAQKVCQDANNQWLRDRHDLERRLSDAEIVRDQLKAAIVGRLRRVEALLERGKGEWPKPSYVKDDTWAGWLSERSSLMEICRTQGIDVTASTQEVELTTDLTPGAAST